MHLLWFTVDANDDGYCDHSAVFLPKGNLHVDFDLCVKVFG